MQSTTGIVNQPLIYYWYYLKSFDQQFQGYYLPIINA